MKWPLERAQFNNKSTKRKYHVNSQFLFSSVSLAHEHSGWSVLWNRSFLFFHIFSFSLIRSRHSPQVQSCKMGEAATGRSSRFRPSKSCKEEVSLLERSKPKELNTKISGLSMFPKLASCSREKISFTRAGECVQRLWFSPYANKLKTWTAFP